MISFIIPVIISLWQEEMKVKSDPPGDTCTAYGASLP